MPPDRRRIYLDHNASAPLLPEARAAMLDALETAGNPSSAHVEGRRARAVIEEARRSVAALVGADPAGVVFTSGASEAAATCLRAEWLDGERPVSMRALAVGETDHPCFRDAVEAFQGPAARLACDASGRVPPATLRNFLSDGTSDAPVLLGLTLANGETGVIADPAPLDSVNGIVVLDAVQAAGRIQLALASLPCAALVLSGHKLGGATGAGAYVLADPAKRPRPLVRGGAQENGRRAGTEAVAAIAAFGAAARVARERLETEAPRLRALRDRFEAAVATLPGVRIVAHDAERLPNTASLAVEGVLATTLQMALDLDGFAVSAGSACMSGKVGPSHVLAAMCAAGAPVDPNLGAVRVSFGWNTTADDVDAFVDAFGRVVRRTVARAKPRAA